MLQLKNSTPLKAAFAKFPNAAGVDTLYLVVAATFRMAPKLELAQTQLPPLLSDEYTGEPATSSLRYAGELHLGKPSTDVILVGSARAPGGKPVTDLLAGVRIGNHETMVQVIGDRTWHGLAPSKPAPFTEMPLVYERAFGGCMRSNEIVTASEDRNPVGVGLGIGRANAQHGDRLPNIEDPRQLLDEGTCPAPVGFGCIAPAWLPRRAFAGTYDERWQKTRAPYLPEDFDSRFFNCASAGMNLGRFLSGGEPLVLLGMHERGPVQTALPSCTLDVAFVLRGQRHRVPVHLQTVLIEADQNRLRLTYHAQFVCDKQVLEVEQIQLGLEKLELKLPG